jgi:drug/metabolite transporter (DMT)-like permease
VSGRPRVPHAVAIAVLVATCALWATSFASVKICGEVLNAGAGLPAAHAFGPLLATALRFTIALPFLLVFWPSARALPSGRGEWRELAGVAGPMAAGFLIQAAGLAFTTATISGFITGLCVCFTPVLEWLLTGRRPSWRLAAGVLLALSGVTLMTVAKPVGSAGFGIGEVLTLICVLAFAVQIVYTGRASERLGSGRLTSGSFAVTALCGWGVVLGCGPGYLPGALRAAVGSGAFWASFALLVFVAGIGAMVLMNIFQKYVRPSEAAVVYTSEPVFTAIFARAVLGPKEALGALGFSGAALMLAANLVVAFKPAWRRRAAADGEPGGGGQPGD